MKETRPILDRWTVLILVGVGGFMVWAAGRYTVFDDEALSCRLYAAPAGDMLGALWRGEDPDPPLYYLLINGWVRLFGVGPIGLRGLSILFFLAGLVFVRLAGAAWFDRTTGLTAMAICGLHPAHLFFGFAARWYALMFALVAALVFVTGRMFSRNAEGRSRETPKRRDAETPRKNRKPKTENRNPESEIQSPTSEIQNPKPETRDRETVRRRGLGTHVVLWGLTAGAICYANYFGPVMVGLIALAAVLRSRIIDRHARGSQGPAADHARPERAGPVSVGHPPRTVGVRHWLAAIGIAAAVYGPWMKPFVEQLGRFPGMGGDGTAWAASVGRTAMALAAGNLAGVTAWWVWAPLGVFALGVVVLLSRAGQRTWVLAGVALGAMVAGTVSGVMIDKYVMTFSGVACLAAAGVIVAGWRDARGPTRRTARVAVLALGLGWCGCYANLIRERDWSSLRWLDPFDAVAAEVARDHPDAVVVASHPAARYYFARLAASPPPAPNAATGRAVRTDPRRWLAAWTEQEREDVDRGFAVRTPDAVVPLLNKEDRPRILVTIETAGFADDPAWRALRTRLQSDYRVEGERRFLEDPAAEWKNRVDRRFEHPRWRIVVSEWTRES